MHVKQARWLDLTVLQVVRPNATNKERDPRVSWFVWIGNPEADLAQIELGYALRFGQEHGYRFDKQALLWEQPRLRTPEQFERWSHVVEMVHNHLVLARDVVEPECRPWESTQRPATPQQVRRGINQLLPRLGTPDHPPKLCGKSKGRRKRSTNTQGNAVASSPQEAETASNGSSVTIQRAFCMRAALFLRNFMRSSGRII